MPLNLSKLEKVEHKADGNIEARCPACAEVGHDTEGNHLIIYSDGRFGCVANQKDTAHNREIFRLAGYNQSPEVPRLQINRLVVPDVTTIMVLPRPLPLAPSEMAEAKQSLEPIVASMDDSPRTESILPKPRIFSEGMSEHIKAFLSR